MRLIVKSRRLAEKDNYVNEPHLIISIRNPTSKVPDLAKNDNTKGALFLEFDDLDHLPRVGSATWNALGKPILFNSSMAKKIIEGIKDTGVHTVIVHCEAGVSRSAGVAAALAKYHNGDDSEFFAGGGSMYSHNPYYPNRHVYRVMLEALHES